MWPVDLPAKVPLDLEGRLVLVDAELLQKVVKVFLKEAFEDLELHHVVVVRSVSRLGVANLRHRDALELGVELLDPLGEVIVTSLLVHSDEAKLPFSTLDLLCLLVE